MDELPLEEKVILILHPGDFRNETGSDLDMVRTVLKIFKSKYPTQVLDFPKIGKNSFPPIGRLPQPYGMFANVVIGSRMKLARTLLRSKGIIFVGYMPVIGFVVLIKKIFCRRYKVIGYVAGMPLSSRIHVRLMYTLLAVFTLSNCDAVVLDFGEARDRFLRYVRLPVLVSCISVDPKTVMNSYSGAKPKGQNCLSKVRVGVIGPFHSGNKPSIAYVLRRFRDFSNDVSFVFVGDVSKGDEFKDKRVTFVGRVDDLIAFLKNLDCVLIPRFFKTGAPMRKMVYSMAAGLPVVTNDLEGMGVTNGREVVLGTLEDLPGLLNDLIADPLKMKTIGNNAKLYVLRHHNLETTKKRLLALANRVFEGQD